ncbi:hypothetical protein CDAR_214051 [Caerostris darwini]|uniref:Uncharacterized protein n=1 Tax=Caerostris darwini TaxID=1538125 RepID=A0AAV4SJ52_9ARAC|nr:hypothetical protein CDAR_214051 [Caerostris darwini]
MLRPLALVLIVFLAAACCSEELKAMFSNLECGGTYDKYKMFAAVGLCEECYNLWKEDTIRDLCSSKCFSTSYFSGCIDSLQLKEHERVLKNIARDLNGQK